MTVRDVTVYLRDILDSIQAIENYLADMDEKVFLEDAKTQDSVIRRLEIIGEAVRSIPADWRSQYPNIPWRSIAGMRDVLIHGYFGVNMERVWETASNDLPNLKKEIQKILKSG